MRLKLSLATPEREVQRQGLALSEGNRYPGTIVRPLILIFSIAFDYDNIAVQRGDGYFPPVQLLFFNKKNKKDLICTVVLRRSIMR